MRTVTSPGSIISRLRRRPTPKIGQAAPVARVEQLESRVLLTGATPATAIPIGALQGGNSFGGTLTTSVPNLFYSFSFINKGTLFFRMRAYEVSGEIDILQDQGTGGTHQYVVIAMAEANSNDESSGNGHIFLTAGQYFVGVVTDGGQTDYLMRVTAQYAGNTLATAENVGTLAGGAVSFIGEVGGDFVIDPNYPEDTYHDPLDIYKFTLTKAANISEDVHLNAGFMAGSNFLIHMELAKDTNNDGTIESNEKIIESGVGTADEYIPAVQLAAGTYYILVDPYNTAYPNYTLTINADYVGNTIATATNLGTLIGQTQARESIGITDTDDQYKVQMSAAGTLTADLSGLSDQAGVKIENSAGSTITSTDPSGTNERSISATVNAGTYYVDVFSSAAGFATNYTLDVTSDYAGNTAATARNIGAVGATPKFFQDYIAFSDNDDFYKFTIGANNQPFEASVGAAYTDGFYPNLFPIAGLYKLNSNGTLTTITVANKQGQGQTLLATLNAGTYEVLVVNGAVNGVSTSGNYSISFEAPPDLAGNDLPHAKNLGTIAGSSSYNDFVGTSDTVDMFKFNMAAAGKFDSTLYTGVSDLYLQLIQDKNNNGVIDTGDVIAGSFNTGNGATQAIHTTLAAGTYYIRVKYNSGPALTYYELGLDANYAGTTLSTARNFGTLSTTKITFADEVDEFSNPSDYYKFTLATAGTVSASLSYTPDENTILELIQDKNKNGNVDSGDILVMTANNGSGSASISKALAAGTYYLRVLNTNGGTNYTISAHR